MLRSYSRCQREHYTPSRSLLQFSKPVMISADTLVVVEISVDMRVLGVNNMAVVEAVAVVTAPNLTNVASSQM